jgi:dihydrofolate synthase / folylpolyglutamate synthase
MKSFNEANDIDIAYQETLNYLYTFVDYSLTRNFRYSPEKFNLERMNELLALLGNPHQDYPVIHVAGTKGKGSTAAMIASAYRAAGKKVGFYSSPHLQEFTERIQINGAEISRQELVGLVNEIRPVLARLEQPPTLFEITTALAFWYFSGQQVDIAVVEVGLGGRLDSTNVVNPLVSVITSLSLDHMAILGDTLPKIAAEKAGIIKPGRPVVSAPQRDEAAEVIRKAAQERASRLVRVGEDYYFVSIDHSLAGQSILIWNGDGQAAMDHYLEMGGEPPAQYVLRIPLLGYHQVQNAATAFAALRVAAEEGFPISDDAIRQGFADVSWPGRFEVLQNAPFLVVDSAHNRDSALRLRLALDDYFPGREVILIFGASEDKDVRGMLEEFAPRVKRVIATQTIHPRAAEPERIVEMVHRLGRPGKSVVPAEKAVEIGMEMAAKEDAVLVAAGSLFLAAAVRAIWQERSGQPRLIGAKK